jgi:hypothetical protein
MHPRGKALVLAIFAVAAALLWEARGDGPDFGHYFEWGRAAVSGDIFELDGDILASGGVPLSQWSAAPGMLFAATYYAAGELIEFRTAAYLTGWAAAMLFWVSAFTALRVAARGNSGLVAFGTGVLFIGTHAGLYSHTYSTELLSSALIAAAWAIALSRTGRGILASTAVAAFAGLLLFVRPYLVLYAVAPLWLVVFHESGPEHDTPARRFMKLLTAAIPLVLAALESAAVNRWMTGSPFRPAYVYGGFGFQSIDLLHPQPGAILTHPWRGLLAYHPLYAIAFVALLIVTSRGGPWRVLGAATVAATLIHLWIQSAWHIWWLGGSFGMRGLAPSAFPLVLALVATLAQDSDERPRRVTWWVRASLIACAWSFPLLLRGTSDYLTWPELLARQVPAAVVAGALVLLWILVAVSRRRWKVPDIRAEVACGGIILLATSLGYLIARTTNGRASATLLFLAAVAAAGVFYLWRMPGSTRAHALRAAGAAACVLFAAQALIFARLAVRTGRYLASGDAPPRQFRSVGAVPIDDLRQNYAEYMDIAGFDDRKGKLRAYLNWLEIDAAKMTPADRDLSERVLRAISSDPIAGAMFVRVMARNRVVHLASSDSNAEQRNRIVEVVGQVPGVAGVEADMK